MKIAGSIKRWLEEISAEMGLDGDITKAVIKEAERRMRKIRPEPDRKSSIDERVASIAHRIAAQRGPVSEAVDKDWNSLHDMESALQKAAHKYDIVASYSGLAARDAAKMLKSIKEVQKALDVIASRKLTFLVDGEDTFIKRYGTPDEAAENLRAEIYPR